MATDLTKRQLNELQRQLSPADIQQLASFTDIGEMLDALKTRKWTGDTELDELIAVARQNENLSAKISAIKYIRELLYETMQASGLMVKATRTFRGADGTTLTLSSDLIASALEAKQKRDKKQKGETNNASDPNPENTKGKEAASEDPSHRPPKADTAGLLPGIATSPPNSTSGD